MLEFKIIQELKPNEELLKNLKKYYYIFFNSKIEMN